MDNMQENTTGIVPEEQENVAAAAAAADNKPRPWYKVPVIMIPALLALAAMLYVFGNAAYYSMVRYSAKNGLLGSPFVGLVNYRRLFDGQGWSAVKDTLVIKILALAVCGAISALMCSLYRVMKKPGTLLAVACLWLVPVALPADMVVMLVRRGVVVMTQGHNGAVYLAGTGLQTIGIFCFTGGLFAYLKKNPYSGLLTAVLVWLLGNLSTNAVFLYGVATAKGPFPLDFHITDYFMMSMRVELCSATSVIKVVFQVLLGIVPAVLLCRGMEKDNTPGIRTTRTEFRTIPATLVCAAVVVIAGNLTKLTDDIWIKETANSVFIALAGGAAGGLVAWSFVRLLRRSSGRVFGITALMLSASMTCILGQFMLFHTLRQGHNTIIPQTLLAAFDWRVVMLAVILAYILRTHSESRTINLVLALMLLAGACTWIKPVLSYLYERTNNTSLSHHYMTVMNQEYANAPNPDRLRMILLGIIPPVLMGTGAAFLMKRAFKDIPEKE